MIPVFLRHASFALLAGLASITAAAQTWTGLGADNNWSTGANWSGGVAPASSATTQVTFPASPRFSPVVDMPWTVNRIDLQVAYTLTGQPITFAGTTPGLTVGFRADVSNPIVLTGATAIGVMVALDLRGGITGTGPLTLGAVGGVGLHGANTFTGGTTVFSGGLGLFGSLSGPLTMNAGSSLRGNNGTVGGPVTVNAGSGISGILATGDLTVSGNMTLAINGTGVGQHDSITVTGTVNLTGATLILSGSYEPRPQDEFILIDNDGTDPVVGTFAGLPEGSLVFVNGVQRRLSYIGGTGNDVVLHTSVLGLVREAPTLSEWALILLAAAMLMLGMRRIGRGAR